jgi:membrane-bound ClpP family serine protease
MDMRLRAIIAIITTLLDEALVIFILLWALPEFGIDVPMPVIVAVVIIYAIFCVFLYIYGTRVLRQHPVIGLTDMTGMKGEASTDLLPEGWVKIKGEIWRAASLNGDIKNGTEILVIDQKGLKLIVKQDSDKKS